MSCFSLLCVNWGLLRGGREGDRFILYRYSMWLFFVCLFFLPCERVKKKCAVFDPSIRRRVAYIGTYLAGSFFLFAWDLIRLFIVGRF